MFGSQLAAAMEGVLKERFATPDGYTKYHSVHFLTLTVPPPRMVTLSNY
jgi:hypothetical protein